MCVSTYDARLGEFLLGNVDYGDENDGSVRYMRERKIHYCLYVLYIKHMLLFRLVHFYLVLYLQLIAPTLLDLLLLFTLCTYQHGAR